MAASDSLLGMSKMGDLKRRLLFLLGALIVFRIGAHIPVPGIDPVALESQRGLVLEPGLAFRLVTMITLVTGPCSFLMCRMIPRTVRISSSSREEYANEATT